MISRLSIVTAGYFYDTFAYEIFFDGTYFYGIYSYGRYFYRAFKLSTVYMKMQVNIEEKSKM
jgi:hypothetical protein